MKELISPVTNFLEARKTPFFSIYLSVVLVRNWELFLKLISLDSLSYRVALIKEAYPTALDFFFNIVGNIVITLVFIILTFLALACARYLTDMYQFKVVPKIRELFDKDKKTLVTKEYVQILKESMDSAEKKASEESELKRKSELENLELKEKVNQAEEKHSKLYNEYMELNRKKDYSLINQEQSEKVTILEDENIKLKAENERLTKYKVQELAEQVVANRSEELLRQLSSLGESFDLDHNDISKDRRYIHLIQSKLLGTESMQSKSGSSFLRGELTTLGVLVVNELEKMNPSHD